MYTSLALGLGHNELVSATAALPLLLEEKLHWDELESVFLAVSLIFLYYLMGGAGGIIQDISFFSLIIVS